MARSVNRPAANPTPRAMTSQKTAALNSGRGRFRHRNSTPAAASMANARAVLAPWNRQDSSTRTSRAPFSSRCRRSQPDRLGDQVIEAAAVADVGPGVGKHRRAGQDAEHAQQHDGSEEDGCDARGAPDPRQDGYGRWLPPKDVLTHFPPKAARRPD